MSALFTRLSVRRRDTYRLVLQSMGIAHDVRPGRRGWEIRVRASDRGRAVSVVRRYRIENSPADQPAWPPAGRRPSVGDGILIAGVLLAVYLNRPGTDPDTARTFGAWAARIQDGEWFRCATALLIHGSQLHLMSNMVGIALFGAVVCSLAGAGAGTFLIAAAGVVGNAVNALLHPPGHLSIGASTAVFGAIGILCGHQLVGRIAIPGQRLRALLPVGGGLALLAMLGASPHADVLAHLFGLLGGLLIAAPYFRLWPRPLGGRWQSALLASTLAGLAACWLAA
jgi:rhomboid protease GluP